MKSIIVTFLFLFVPMLSASAATYDCVASYLENGQRLESKSGTLVAGVSGQQGSLLLEFLSQNALAHVNENNSTLIVTVGDYAGNRFSEMFLHGLLPFFAVSHSYGQDERTHKFREVMLDCRH